MPRGTKDERVSKPVAASIGSNISRIRKDAVLSQAALCAASGLSQSTLSRVENGDYPGLDLEHLVKLALALNTSLGDLMFGTDMAMTIVRYEQGRK